MSVNISQFEILKEQRRKDYKTWKPIYSPALGEKVIFNSNGFKHLRFSVDGTPRNPKEAMYKLRLLPLARPVIQQVTKVEEYRKRKGIEYWGILGEVGTQKHKIRVILRKVGSGKLHFWSIMKLT